MEEQLLLYSVVQYVPRPERGEFVNVGVIVVSSDGAEAAAQFTQDWRRARSLGQATDIDFLRSAARRWRKTIRPVAEKGQLFPDAVDAKWLEDAARHSANIVQFSEPRRAFASSASSLAVELFRQYVATATVTTAATKARTRRGLQLSFEAELRRSGLGDAFERDYIVGGAAVAEWTFDYVIRNGRPIHLVQTLNLNLVDHRQVLSEATYAAFAKRDLAARNEVADLPLSVIADAPDKANDLMDETRAILEGEGVPLVLRDELPQFIDRIGPVVASRL